MQNALNKFHAIFMAYTPKEQMELIARSRTAAVDRRMKQYDRVIIFPTTLYLAIIVFNLNSENFQSALV